MRTEPPSPRQPVLAGSASRHVITTREKNAGTTPAPRPPSARNRIGQDSPLAHGHQIRRAGELANAEVWGGITGGALYAELR
jgi:hypothetical protein